jgi:hypothetical protein
VVIYQTTESEMVMTKERMVREKIKMLNHFTFIKIINFIIVCNKIYGWQNVQHPLSQFR